MPGLRGSAAARERRRITTPVALFTGGAWMLLALGSAEIAVPSLCTGRLLWSMPSEESLALVVAINGPGRLAFGWAIMVTAMMVPVLSGLLVHVRQRSLTRSRPGCMTALVCGFAAAWMLAGFLLIGLAIGLQLSFTSWEAALAAFLALAVVWQLSPLKQLALNKCHVQPAFSAFGIAAYRDCLAIGFRTGCWCVTSCWALMLVALAVPAFHLLAMAAVALLVWAERLEPPRHAGWQIRKPIRLYRFLTAQLLAGTTKPAAGALPQVGPR